METKTGKSNQKKSFLKGIGGYSLNDGAPALSAKMDRLDRRWWMRSAMKFFYTTNNIPFKS